MYTIYNDGQLLFNPGAVTDDHILLEPSLSLDVKGAGSLEFVMPPGHAQYDAIRKLKGIITVKQGEDIIFRGRAMDDEKDFYNQKDCYCEGDRSFFMDSQCAPYTYTGTVIGLLAQLVDDHNSQVEADKRFELGTVNAVSSSETLTVENMAYWETWKEIDEKLLSAYGGYMKTRTEGGITYLDWLAVSGKTNSQVIQFSVNLLDLKDKVDAADVFTVLIPLGASTMGDGGDYNDPVNIASVNGGLHYIQDDDAVAKYGKIWRTKTWNYVEDPSELLEKGREYLNTGIALQTLTLKAIDMHFIDGSAEAIRVGDHVRILSDPHGLDLTIICTRIDIDMLNPENTMYTFGEAPRALTDNVVKTEEVTNELSGGRGGGGGGKKIQEELKDYVRWAEIKLDEKQASIDLLTGQANNHGERLSKAEISLDGVNAQIVLKANVDTVDDLGRRVSNAEIEIDGAFGMIALKASQSDLDAVTGRVSTAEASLTVQAGQIESKVSKDGVISTINQTPESVRISASKINLDGFVTTSALSSEITNLKSAFAQSLSVSNFECGSLRYKGYGISLTSKTVVTSISESKVSSFNVVINASTGATRAIRYVDDISWDTETIYYMSYE